MPYAIAAFDAMLYMYIQQAGQQISQATTQAGRAVQSAIDANTKAIDNQTDMQKEKWKETNEHLTTVAQRMCAWAAPEYNEIGEGYDRKAMLVAQAAIYTSIIALNTYVQNQNYKIARAYADLAVDKVERFQNNYVPLELKMLYEVSAMNDVLPDYSGSRTRARNANAFAYNSANSEMRRRAKQLALCMDDSLDLSTDKALLRDDTINFNYRDAETFATYKADKRWNRRSDILNIGRNNHATAFSYAQHASQAFSGFAGAIAQVGNGISGLLGYMNNRNETVYPAMFSQATLYGSGALAAGGTGVTRVH